MFPVPPNHTTRLQNICNCFNAEIKHLVEEAREHEYGHKHLNEKIRSFTEEIVMDNLTQEDLIFFAKLRMSEIFLRHVRKCLKEKD